MLLSAPVAAVTRFCSRPAPVWAAFWMLPRMFWPACTPRFCCWVWACSMLAWALVCDAWAVIAVVCDWIRSLAWASDIEPSATLPPSCWMSCFCASEMLTWFLFSVKTGWPLSPMVTTNGEVVSGVRACPAWGEGGGFQSAGFSMFFVSPLEPISWMYLLRGSLLALVQVTFSGSPSASLNLTPSSVSYGTYVLPLLVCGWIWLACRPLGVLTRVLAVCVVGSYSTSPTPATVVVVGLSGLLSSVLVVPSGLIWTRS